MSTEPAVLIRDEIKTTMRAAGISEAALSRDAYIARSTLARKLAGASEFTVDELFRVAVVLGTDAATLIASASAA